MKRDVKMRSRQTITIHNFIITASLCILGNKNFYLRTQMYKSTNLCGYCTIKLSAIINATQRILNCQEISNTSNFRSSFVEVFYITRRRDTQLDRFPNHYFLTTVSLQ